MELYCVLILVLMYSLLSNAQPYQVPKHSEFSPSRSEGFTGEAFDSRKEVESDTVPVQSSGQGNQWEWHQSWGDTSRERSENSMQRFCARRPNDPRCQRNLGQMTSPPEFTTECGSCFRRNHRNRFFRPTPAPFTNSEWSSAPNQPSQSWSFRKTPPLSSSRSQWGSSTGSQQSFGSAESQQQTLGSVSGPQQPFMPQSQTNEERVIVKETLNPPDTPFNDGRQSDTVLNPFSTGDKFGFLSNDAKQAMLQNCASGIIDCRAQPDEMVQKKSMILQREMSLYQSGNVPLSIGGGYGYRPHGYGRPQIARSEMVEKRLSMIQKLKQSLLEVAGMSSDVTPIDDGTFQQDVLLTEQQSSTMIDALRNYDSSSTAKRFKRASLFFEQMPSERWDVSAPIPYYFDDTLEEYEKQMVRQAHRAIESNTCIRFAVQSTKPDGKYLYYIKIASPTFCGLSYIGKVTPLNPIYLSFACQDPVGVALHETMHSLGALHQHLRTDRDNYLQMQWSNINPQLYDYFAIADPSKFTPYGVKYDYSSIMHYAPFTGALEISKPTMVPKFDPESNLPRMGQRKVLSPSDVELLNDMYCKPACQDKNVYCGVWALRNLCTRPAQIGWMEINCRKSCKLC